VVITTARQIGVPSALLSAISARIALRMANADDLMSLGVPRDIARGAELPDGRGFLNGRTEVQVATVSPDPDAAAQAAAISFVGGHFARNGVRAAAPLPELPALVRRPDQLTGPPLRPYLGIADLSLEPVTVDLARQNLVVVGPPGSGRSAALATIAAGVAAGRTGDGAPRLIGVGGAVSPLAKLDLWDLAGFGRGAARDTLREAAGEVSGDEGSEVRLVVLVDGAEDVESIENGPVLESLIRSDVVRMVVVAEPATLGRAYSGWTAELKTNRALLFLQPSSVNEIETVAGVKPTLRPAQSFPAGRAVLLDRRATRLVQVALPDHVADGTVDPGS
jgi:S-DNA-T family DNA segregation ATPase FtsK/SpoIIIE